MTRMIGSSSVVSREDYNEGESVQDEIGQSVGMVGIKEVLKPCEMLDDGVERSDGPHKPVH